MHLAPLEWDILVSLQIPSDHKIYTSNVWYIVVPKNKEYVFKIFLSSEVYKKELMFYGIFAKEGLSTPAFEWLGKIGDYFVLKLENIRKDFKRKNNMIDLDLFQVSQILQKIHTIDPSVHFNNKATGSLILGDVHSSNFFEMKEGRWKARLWIFDFSSARLGEKEEDLANLYIDICLDDSAFQSFLASYRLEVDLLRIYRFTFLELQERIKNGMNLKIEKKKLYYKFMLTIRDKMLTHGV